MEELVFRDADVVDGSGAPSYRADVVVDRGRIVSIVREAAAAGCQRPMARRELDAEGLVLSPGFIDLRAHSDLALLRDPDHSAKAAQGVTLEVLGQDGLSYAPVDDRTLDEVRRALTGRHGPRNGVDVDWRSVGEYLDRLDRGIAVNAAYLVPQGTVRALVVGREDRAATPTELDRMRRLVAEGMEQGAVGMSSGPTHPPGRYTRAAELTELCRVVAEYGGYHCPQRAYGAGASRAYGEMVGVAREAGCALHLPHAPAGSGVEEGRAPSPPALLDDALAAGADISFDTSSYLSAATTLAALLPGWVAEDGPEATLGRLADDATAARVRRELETAGVDGCPGVPVAWEAVEVSGVTRPELADHVGRTVRESADLRGEDPWTTARRLLLDDRLGTTVLLPAGDEEDVRAVMRHRAHTGGSDGILAGARPHPRAYGTFPRYLGRYVRELGVLSLEECVAHLTGRPAARLRLPDRGLVREGYRADLVLFDPRTVAEGATFAAPRTLPTGIPYVLVDGRFVIEDGHRTDVLAGRAVRRAPWRP